MKSEISKVSIRGASIGAAMVFMIAGSLVACELRDPRLADPIVAEVAGAPLEFSSDLGYRLVRVDEAWAGVSKQPLSIRLDYEFALPETMGPLMSGFTLVSTPSTDAGDSPIGEAPEPDQISIMQGAYEHLRHVERTGETELNFSGELVSALMYRGIGVQTTGATVPVEIVFAQRQSKNDIITMLAVYPLTHFLELENIKLIAEATRHPLDLHDENLKTTTMALTAEDPQVAERIINHYVPSKATLIARSHAVGNYQGCVATWIGPNTALTAAHCGNRNTVSMEIYPDGDFGKKYSLAYTCNSERATAFWASNSDLRILECGQGQYPAPGDIYGWVDYSILGLDQVGDPVYSVWTNPITDVVGAGASTRLYSEGEVVATDSQTWANPNCERPDHWLAENPSRGEPYFGHQTSVYGESGASGSLQFSSTTHTAVVAPTSTAPESGGNRRFASSIGQILEVDGYLPPGEVYWLETNVDTSMQRPQADRDNPENSDRNEATGCLLEANQGLLQNRVRSNASGSRALDVHEEIDNQITQRPIYNLDFNSEWRRLLWTGRTAFGGFSRELGYTSEEAWQTHAKLFTSQPDGATGLRHAKLNLGLGAIYDVRVEYAWSEGITMLPDLELSIDGCTSEIVPTNQVGAGGQARGYHWVHFVLDTSNCSGFGEFSVNLASAGSIDLRRILIVKEGSTWDFETWDSREPWTESRPNHRFENHGLVYGAHGNGSRFSAYLDPSDGPDRGLGLPGAPIRGGECYEMTFDARAVDSSNKSVTLIVESGDGLDSIFEETLSPGLSWSHHAVLFKTEDGQKDAVPRFEIGPADSGRVAIDDIRFIPDPNTDLNVWVGGRNPRYVEISFGSGGLQAANTPVVGSASLPTCDDPGSSRLDLTTMEWLTDTGSSLSDLSGQPQLGQNATVPGSYLADGSGGFQARHATVQYAVEGQQGSDSVLLRPCVRRDNFQDPILPILASYPTCPRNVIVGSIIDDLISAFGTASVRDLVGKILTFPDFPDVVGDEYPGCQPTWCPLPYPGSIGIPQALEKILDEGRYGRLSVTFLGQMAQVLDQSSAPGQALAGLEKVMMDASGAGLKPAESEMLLAAYSAAQSGLAVTRPGEAFDRAFWNRALEESERQAFFSRGATLQPASDALAGFISAVAVNAYPPQKDDAGEWLKHVTFGAAVGVASAYRQFRDEPVR